MPKYIEADELKDKYHDKMVELIKCTTSNMSEEALSLLCGCTLINAMPTADVRENVHAHWEIVYDEDCDSGGKYICGNCRHAFSFGAYFELCRFDYCPNCGAVMDERKEE